MICKGNKKTEKIPILHRLLTEKVPVSCLKRITAMCVSLIPYRLHLSYKIIIIPQIHQKNIDLGNYNDFLQVTCIANPYLL